MPVNERRGLEIGEERVILDQPTHLFLLTWSLLRSVGEASHLNTPTECVPKLASPEAAFFVGCRRRQRRHGPADELSAMTLDKLRLIEAELH
jgi:hypothetical protein